MKVSVKSIEPLYLLNLRPMSLGLSTILLQRKRKRNITKIVSEKRNTKKRCTKHRETILTGTNHTNTNQGGLSRRPVEGPGYSYLDLMKPDPPPSLAIMDCQERGTGHWSGSHLGLRILSDIGRYSQILTHIVTYCHILSHIVRFCHNIVRNCHILSYIVTAL